MTVLVCLVTASPIPLSGLGSPVGHAVQRGQVQSVSVLGQISWTFHFRDKQIFTGLLRTQEISVALLINPRNVGGEIRKTFVIKCAN